MDGVVHFMKAERAISMRVTEFLTDLQQEKGFADETCRTYRSHWKCACRWLGDDDLFSLTVRDLNRYLTSCERDGHAAATIQSIRASLSAVLRAAQERWPGVAPAGKVRRVRQPVVLPQTWTVAEVQRLIEAANTRWWNTLLRGAWYTGLRRTDLLLLERQQFDGEGVAEIVQHKTGKRLAIAMPVSLLQELPHVGKLWTWRLSYETFRRQFAAIVKRAAIPRGPFKRIRKSAGNEAERLRPWCGHLFLGNERRTFERHYLARSGQPVVRLPDPGGG